MHRVESCNLSPLGNDPYYANSNKYVIMSRPRAVLLIQLYVAHGLELY